MPRNEPSNSMPALRVVVVEDSPMIRARIVETLAALPNVSVVCEVETEQAAIDALKGVDWDAAVLDLQLKQGTGLGVLKALRGKPRAPGARMIVFTNYAFPQYRDRSLSLGADYFFDKAREFDRVREVIEELARTTRDA